MKRQTVRFRDLGPVEYGKAWAYQESLMKANLSAKADWFSGQAQEKSAATTHHLLFCEHPHVYTLGKSGLPEHLLLSDARLRELDASFYQTNRGGDITYHGPGQIVGYPILDLECFFTDLGRYMRSLEEVIIRTLAHYNIKGDRLPGATGVWLDPGTSAARKICAMGVKCSRWVTMHGFALNVNTDLDYFNNIVPCGIRDKGVTSIQKELGSIVSVEETKKRILDEFADVFGAEILPEKITSEISEDLYL